MARIPTVAIIGRPNTGKSTLFNRMVGKRRAIESPVAGTTRDHVVYRMETDDVDYMLLDTGGIGGGSEDKDFENDVSAQSIVALASADVILFTLNSREELTSGDYAVVELLRKRKKGHVPVLLVATKCDAPGSAELKLPEYYALGIADTIIAVSAVHAIGLAELEAAIVEQLKALHFEKEVVTEDKATRPPRIAIVGKPNVGKSSIVNALMSDTQREQSPRLVSEIPGTTRDSSDTLIRNEDQEYIFIDTAGLRRKARVEEDLEYLSTVKSIQAIEDSDVTVLVLDASEPISRQEKRIASMAIELGKGLVLVLNKADLLSGEQRKEKEAEMKILLPFCTFAPVLFTSAKTRDGLVKLFPLLQSVARNRLRRIPTKELLRWYESAIQRIPAAALNRSKFITQAEEIPPTFVVFVKKPRDVQLSQLRFLENALRSTFAFEGTPIKWITKAG